MLITLLTIAIASLAAAPVVIPAVKRLRDRDEEIDHSHNHSESSIDSSDDRPSDLPERHDESSLEDQQALALNTIPDFSLELVRPSATQSSKAAKPLVEIIWQSPNSLDKKASRAIRLDDVEKIRRTPSADHLFDEASSPSPHQHILESANPEEPNRLISPKQIAKPPAAAQIKSVQFNKDVDDETSKAISPASVSAKSIPVHSEKFKMRPTTDQGGSRRSTAIPMIISEVPSAVKQNQHFEVIKPVLPVQERRFSLLDPPEEMAMGERAWRSVQPLYIDFSPFFSLDSLIHISPNSKRDQRRRRDLVSGGRAGFNKEIAHSTRDQSTDQREHDAAMHEALLRDLNAEQDRLRYVGDVDEDFDYSLDDLDDNEELEWSQREGSEIDELEDIPEWQSLLSLSSNFLFDLKLSQRSKSSHHALTEQSLEDSIVFKITSGPTGPEVESNHSETAD